jgi:hypothetical protein
MSNPERTESISYVAPEVKSLTEAEILEVMGPAQAYTGTIPFGF